jgi:glycogen debranching enzyme
MNVDISDGERLTAPRGAIHLFRSRFFQDGLCYELVRLSNYSLEPLETFLTCEFEADYRDIFEVRGTVRERQGTLLPMESEERTIIFGYQGLDGVVRRTRVEFSMEPESIEDQRVPRWHFKLRPKEESALYITTACVTGNERKKILVFDVALHQATEEVESAVLHRTTVAAPDPRFNAWLARSAVDLKMMVAGNPEGAFPYAGVPWYNTVFGRDSILTAMECLWIEPSMAKSVLRHLAETQATEVNRAREAEPGKIIHETRGGEMAALNEVPFGRYYGSIDSTPLFVMLAGAYLERTADSDFLRTIRANILAALDWIDQYGDVDGDGFVEYQAKSSHGLVQQGWKDSHDAVFYEDGRIAEPPIALCEVQGYVYAAKLAGARLARAFGEPEFGERLEREARALKEEFNREFWDEELGTYALALDGKKRKCRVKTSNPGHCLFSGIAADEHAARIAASLLSDELFSGWGIRTLAGGEVRYNPMSYHNGSVWPHDNAIAASGLAFYGFHRHAAKVFSALLDVSEVMELRRLPELFCGFHRRSHCEGPTLYPVACSPQAWAAGAVYMLLEACLGISFKPEECAVSFDVPFLPRYLRGLTIRKLSVGDSQVDIRIEEDGAGGHAEILRQTGNAVVMSQGTSSE